MTLTPDGQFEGTERDGLIYPFEEVPKIGELFEIAPGVNWIRMELPFSLNHINLWLLDDGDGWTIIDTGISSGNVRDAWLSIFDNHLHGKPVNRVIVTHLHPDHIGLAGWITRKFDAMLWMSRTDYLHCRSLAGDTGRQAPEVGIKFYRAAGFSQRDLDTYAQRFGGFGSNIYHIPDQYRRVVDKETFMIGKHEWQVVIGRGHTPEHVCLHCPELKLLISGDQVLPRITSNIGLFPTEPFADPLRDWLDSCAELQTRLPNDLLVLPAHNLPFYGLHERLQQLIDGHEENLEALLELLNEPKRAIDVFDPLFKSKVNEHTFFMATGESLAHLSCLVYRNQISRTQDENGVDWYQKV